MKKWLLLPFALLVWGPIWLLFAGAITGEAELQATLGPALINSGQAWLVLLPSWPTLQTMLELLLDTPEYFVTYWNTCAQVLPQVAGQCLVGAPAAWALSRLVFPGRRAVRSLYIV